MAIENFCSPETYTTVHKDADDDWISWEKSDGTNYVAVHSTASRACVRVNQDEVPALLRKIAAAAGLEVLILPKPKQSPFTLLNVTPTPADPGTIQVDRGFEGVFRLTPAVAADLIWRMAEALAKSSLEPKAADVSTLVADLRLAGLVVNTSASAKKLLQAGYSKDPARKAAVEPLINVFNCLPEVTGGRN